MSGTGKNTVRVSKRSINFLIPLYIAQDLILLCVFFILPEYFGYICLGSLLVQQISAILLNNILPTRENKLILRILWLIGGGFIAIVRIFSDTEKKGSLSNSNLHNTVFIIQGILIYTLFYIWFLQTKIYILITIIASIAVSLLILLSHRDIEEKITSVLLIFLLFGYGYLIFFFADPRPYFATFRKRYCKISGNKGAHPKGAQSEDNGLLPKLESMGFYSAAHESAEYFPTGKRFFDDVEAHLAEAKKYIYMEFFLYEDGALFERIAPILSQKAREGVDVRMICDDIGTYRSVVSGILPDLISSGVKCIPYNRVIPLVNTLVQYRDHRKMLVIDGERAYVGGVNIADEYTNEKQVFGYWKDAGVRVDGEAAKTFSNAFRCQWYAISGECICELEPVAACSSETFTIPYFDGMEQRKKICEDVYSTIIESATEKITVITPYFIPGRRMIKLLRKKAEQGVDITLVIPGRADKFYVNAVTRVNAEALIKHGIKVCRMQGSFTHSKVILTESYAAIGTANFDYQSFRKSSECGVITNDSKVILQVATDISCVLRVCEAVSEENRFKCKKFKYFIANIYRLVSILM